MLKVYALRHGLTQWNLDKRIQGRTDIPLCETGRDALTSSQLAPEWQQFNWFSSPLLRCRQTCECLNFHYRLAEELIEMDWADWEGQTLAELANRYGADFRQNEARGLDMLPANGESPREVLSRVTTWIKHLSTEASEDQAIAVVTHKGVIRALLAAALDWDMKSDLSIKIDYTRVQAFSWNQATEQWSLVQNNIPLSENPFRHRT